MNYIIDDFGYRRFIHGEGEKTPIDRTKLKLETFDEGYDQYYVKYEGRTVGYIHCRSAYTEAICPEEGGDDVVYEAEICGFYKFAYSERHYHLTRALESIARWLNDNGFWFFLTSDSSDRK